MSRNRINYDEIREQHLDNMIRLAFMQADAIDTQELVEGKGMDDFLADKCEPGRAYRMFLEKLERYEAQERRRKRSARLRRGLMKGIEIAACLVLIIGIAAPIAVANVESVRVKVMELLVNIQEDHTRLSLEKCEETDFFVPEGWEGDYYPSYIPEGYEYTEVDDLTTGVSYINKDGKCLYFDEYEKADRVNINSENAVISYAKVNDENVFVAETDDFVIVTWSMDCKYFVVISGENKEEALAVAQSVTCISE